MGGICFPELTPMFIRYFSGIWRDYMTLISRIKIEVMKNDS